MSRKPRAKPLASGKAVVKRAPKPKPAPVLIETLEVPAALLLAAETVAAKAGKDAPRLHGVLIHQVEPDRARVVATDGARLFVASFQVPKTPEWLKTGLLLDREHLKTRVGLLTKIEDAAYVLVSYGAGGSRAELADPHKSAVMQIAIGHAASFPPYDKVLTEASFTTLDEAGEDDAKDWQAVGFNSRSLKYCGDIAKILETGLPKDRRPKEGMVIRAFGGQDGAPKAFDFPQAPGIILVMQPIPAGYLPIAAETVPLLSSGLEPAMRLTVAALRAHATRWRQKLGETEDPGEKDMCLAKIVTFEARIEAVFAKAPGMQKTLAGPVEQKAEVPMPRGTDAPTVH